VHPRRAARRFLGPVRANVRRPTRAHCAAQPALPGTTRATQRCGESPGVRACSRAVTTKRGDALRAALPCEHHAAGACPGLGVGARCVQAGRLPSAGGRSPLGLRDGMPRHTRHLMACGLRVAPRHHLGRGAVALPAHDPQGVRPGVPQGGRSRGNTARRCVPLQRVALRLVVNRRPARPA
jgi:hypothetical protein